MVAELLPAEPEALGLAALVLLARSRDAARLDEAGAMVPLSQQGPERWDRARIAHCAELSRPKAFEPHVEHVMTIAGRLNGVPQPIAIKRPADPIGERHHVNRRGRRFRSTA